MTAGDRTSKAKSKKECCVLYVNLHSIPRKYIGGGGLAFLDLLRASSATGNSKLILLENSPSFKEVYNIDYDSVVFEGSMPYEDVMKRGKTITAVIALRAALTSIRAISIGIKIVRKRNVLLIVSPNERLPSIISTFVIAKITGRRLVIMLHALPVYESALLARKFGGFGMGSVIRFQRSEHPGFVSSIAYALMKYLASEMNKRSICITNNPLFTELLKEHGNYQRVYTCSLTGLNLDWLRSLETQDKIYDAVYAAGSIDSGKGIFDLLKSWSLIVQGRPHLRLVILGSTEADVEIRIRQMIDVLRLNKSVSIPFDLVEGIDWPTLMKQMRRGRVFLYPSIRDSMARVVMEALALGLPVVMYDGGYAHGIYDETSFLRITTTGNTIEFAEQFIELLNGDLPGLSADAMHYAEKFDNEEVAKKQLTLIETLAQNPRLTINP